MCSLADYLKYKKLMQQFQVKVLKWTNFKGLTFKLNEVNALILDLNILQL